MQRRRKTEEGFTLERGGKRKAATTEFLRGIFDAAYQPKKPRLARTISRAVGQLFAGDNEQLQTLDEEERDLRARLREVSNVRSRIMNQGYLHVPTWDDTYPVTCTIELGSNTMSFTGGRNAGILNATVSKYSAMPDKLGGHAVRGLLSELASKARDASKEPALEEDVTLQSCMQGLITSVLQLSSDGVRSISGCVLTHSNQVTETVASENSQKLINVNEVQILFTHLLAWVQLQLMESIPDCKACMHDAWLSNGPSPVSLKQIWRDFNQNVIDKAKDHHDLFTKVRFNMRSVLYCLMPERIEKGDSESQQKTADSKSQQTAAESKPQQKAADLKLFGLMHLQSKHRGYLQEPDPFLQSLLSLEPCQKKAGRAGASKSENNAEKTGASTPGAQESRIKSRASAKSWPGDLSKVQSKAACLSTVAAFVRGILQYPSSAKTSDEMHSDATLFLNTFKPKIQGGQLLTEIVGIEVSCVHSYI